MHVFGIFLLYAFGVMGVTMFAARLHPRFHEMWAATAVMLGIGLAWAAGFDMWTYWSVSVRSAWVGETMTGVALGGSAVFLHALTGFFSSLHRKFADQAEVMERGQLRSVA